MIFGRTAGFAVPGTLTAVALLIASLLLQGVWVAAASFAETLGLLQAGAVIGIVLWDRRYGNED